MNNIYDRVMAVLKEKLSRDEWIELGDDLDSGGADCLLDKVNEHLEEIAPEIFANSSDAPTAR